MGGRSLEVSLTILRNFTDSLAHVDHVRPALRSHGSFREGENGFSRRSEGSEREAVARKAGRIRLRRGHGWRAPRVVSPRCPKICIRDGHADWKRDCRHASCNILLPRARSLHDDPLVAA